MDESDLTVDPQAEVRKLQDLVKKLERQNEVLRGKQKLQLETLQNGEIEKKLGTNHNNNISEGLNHCRLKEEPSEITLDDVNVLDVDQLSVRDEEDSWYKSFLFVDKKSSSVHSYSLNNSVCDSELSFIFIENPNKFE